MRLFFDRCVPIALARMVQGFEGGGGLLIRHHDEDERFLNTTQDIDWIHILGSDGDPTWVIVSGDGRILKNKVERAVLDDVGLLFFCLDHAWMSMTRYEYAWKFMKVWPDVLRHAREKKGRIFRIRAGTNLKVDIER